MGLLAGQQVAEGRAGSVAASKTSSVATWVSNWAAPVILPPSRMLHCSISAAFAFHMSPARRRTAARSVYGRAAQAGWAAAAAVVAAETSATAAMPVRPSSAPVAGSTTVASPPAARFQPPE